MSGKSASEISVLVVASGHVLWLVLTFIHTVCAFVCNMLTHLKFIKCTHQLYHLTPVYL